MPAPSVTSMLEPRRPSIQETERARQEQSISGREDPSVLEPPSLLEEQPSMVVSDMSLAADPRPSVSMAGDLSRQDESVNLPPPPIEFAEQAPDSPLPPSLPSRRESSEDDVEDIFDNDLPDLPDEAENGSSAGSVADEEDQEERRWNKRTQQMSYILNRSYTRGESQVGFRDLVVSNNRKQVSSKFYTLLVLKKMQAVEVTQTEPFGEILISQGPKFEVVV